MAPNKNSKSKKRKSYNKLFLAIALIIIVVTAIGIYFAVNQEAPATFPPTRVLLQTTAGNITVDLRTDKPITSGNFANLVKEGKYDGTIFHPGKSPFFPVQGGQRCKLRPPVEGIGTLPGLDLDELGRIMKPSASAKRATAARWASMPRPERPCLAVETR